jgi:putative endonuclease
MLSFLYRLADEARCRARKRQWTPDLASGRRGEDLAHRYLQQQGLVVVARNYRTRSGTSEVDLIAWEGETLVFAEVKSRATDEFGSPDRAVDLEKQAHLIRAAREYVHRADIDWRQTRFDIVNVVFDIPPRITHLIDVFRVQAAV